MGKDKEIAAASSEAEEVVATEATTTDNAGETTAAVDGDTAELEAKVVALEAEIEGYKEVIADLQQQIVDLEANEDKLGEKMLEAMGKLDEKLAILEHNGRRVKVLRKTIKLLGKIIVFGMDLKEKLEAAKGNKNVNYVAWEELSDEDKEQVMETAPHLFVDADGDGVPDIIKPKKSKK